MTKISYAIINSVNKQFTVDKDDQTYCKCTMSEMIFIKEIVLSAVLI